MRIFQRLATFLIVLPIISINSHFVAPSNQPSSTITKNEGSMSVDCNIKMKGKIGDVEYEVVVTVEDVSVFQCAKLKLAAFFS